MDALPNLPTTGRATVIRFPAPGAIDRSAQRARKDDPTHATALGFAYVNEMGRDAFSRQPFVFPAGTILVRERVLPPSTDADQLVVMVKREHRFIRADRHTSYDDAVEFSLSKARQLVDQQGERIFNDK